MKKFIALLFILVFALGVASSALAVHEAGHVSQGPIEGIQDKEALLAKIDQVIDIIFVILLVASIIFIILGAFQFVTAGGKPESVSEARQKIIWAIVGIVIALFARAIPGVIEGILR